jgi:hypothetical protein
VLSKQLWKALRRQRRQRIEEDIDRLAQEGGGLKKLKGLMQKQSGTQRIARIKDKDGELQLDPDHIAEVFAYFYEDLYREMEGHNEIPVQHHSGAVPVTTDEVEQALKPLKHGKMEPRTDLWQRC